MVVKPYNQAQTTQPPQYCQNHNVAKQKNTLWLVNHILCGYKCVGKSWQSTPSWISTVLWRANCKTSRRGPVVKILGKWGRQQGKQTSLESSFKSSVMAVWWVEWETKEKGGRIEEDREGQRGRKVWECWQRRDMIWKVSGRKVKRWKD